MNVTYQRVLQCVFLILAFLYTGFQTAGAQPDIQRDHLLASPHAAMRTHLLYLQHDSYQPEISAYTIPPSTDSTRKVKLAIQIKQILDGKGLYVRLNQISQDPDYIDSIAEAHIFTPFPRQAPEIYLERYDSLWYYSEETIESVPELHRSLYPLGADLLSRRMPDTLRERFLGIAIWQYLGILAVVIMALLFHSILSLILRPVIKWLAAHIRNLDYADPKDVMKATRIVSIILILFVVLRCLPVLQLPINLSSFIVQAMKIAIAIMFMLFGLLTLRTIMKHFTAIAQVTESKMDDQLLPVIRKLLQVVIVGAAVIYILSRLNVNVTALIAGISIGALAIALAAQDTIKNLIGSLMVFVDKPFQVGDWVIIDGEEGEIIEVGFRSTRIKLLDTAIVSIPNGNVANSTIKNLGIRNMRLMNTLIGVTYDTPPDKIEQFIEELKQLIRNHPGVYEDNSQVRFREMGDFSLKILFRCFIPVQTFGEELDIKEQLYLEIVRIAERMGIEFAFPTQTIHVEK